MRVTKSDDKRSKVVTLKDRQKPKPSDTSVALDRVEKAVAKLADVTNQAEVVNALKVISAQLTKLSTEKTEIHIETPKITVPSEFKIIRDSKGRMNTVIPVYEK